MADLPEGTSAFITHLESHNRRLQSLLCQRGRNMKALQELYLEELNRKRKSVSKKDTSQKRTKLNPTGTFVSIGQIVFDTMMYFFQGYSQIWPSGQVDGESLLTYLAPSSAVQTSEEPIAPPGLGVTFDIRDDSADQSIDRRSSLTNTYGDMDWSLGTTIAATIPEEQTTSDCAPAEATEELHTPSPEVAVSASSAKGHGETCGALDDADHLRSLELLAKMVDAKKTPTIAQLTSFTWFTYRAGEKPEDGEEIAFDDLKERAIHSSTDADLLVYMKYLPAEAAPLPPTSVPTAGASPAVLGARPPCAVMAFFGDTVLRVGPGELKKRSLKTIIKKSVRSHNLQHRDDIQLRWYGPDRLVAQLTNGKILTASPHERGIDWLEDGQVRYHWQRRPLCHDASLKYSDDFTTNELRLFGEISGLLNRGLNPTLQSVEVEFSEIIATMMLEIPRTSLARWIEDRIGGEVEIRISEPYVGTNGRFEEAKKWLLWREKSP